MIDNTIFRAYDIRGKADETLTVEAVELVGRVVGSMVLERGEKALIIARDARVSGPKLFKALSDGVMSTGCDVVDIGIVPTPVLYFATHVLEEKSGIVITGSHNPPQDNGLKIVIGERTLTSEGIQAIRQRIEANDFLTGHGSMRKESLLSRYIERICSDVKLNRPLKIVIDCGNGVASVVAGDLYRKMGCEVIELFCELDGTFPNHPADPSVIDNLKDISDAVIKHQADIGLAFDGDADRLGVVTNTGKIIFSDRVVMLLATDVLKRAPGATIVYDVKCTHFLKPIITEHGGVPVMEKTGHSNIKAAIIDLHAALGGELSGHIFFKERWYGFDDAIYSGARLLEVLAKQDKTSDEMFAAFPDSVNTPELRLPISDDKKFTFMDQFKAHAKFENANIITIDGLRVEFKEGWGLLRPSNTTPNLILRFEANDEAALKRIQKEFGEQILALDPALKLPF